MHGVDETRAFCSFFESKSHLMLHFDQLACWEAPFCQWRLKKLWPMCHFTREHFLPGVEICLLFSDLFNLSIFFQCPFKEFFVHRHTLWGSTMSFPPLVTGSVANREWEILLHCCESVWRGSMHCRECLCVCVCAQCVGGRLSVGTDPALHWSYSEMSSASSLLSASETLLLCRNPLKEISSDVDDKNPWAATRRSDSRCSFKIHPRVNISCLGFAFPQGEKVVLSVLWLPPGAAPLLIWTNAVSPKHTLQFCRKIADFCMKPLFIFWGELKL